MEISAGIARVLRTPRDAGEPRSDQLTGDRRDRRAGAARAQYGWSSLVTYATRSPGISWLPSGLLLKAASSAKIVMNGRFLGGLFSVKGVSRTS
jgi:hypothetical protein